MSHPKRPFRIRYKLTSLRAQLTLFSFFSQIYATFTKECPHHDQHSRLHTPAHTRSKWRNFVFTAYVITIHGNAYLWRDRGRSRAMCHSYSICRTKARWPTPPKSTMEIQIFTASLHQNVVLTEYQRKSEIISCAIENERAKQRWEESAWSKTPKSGVFLANSKYSSDKRGGFTRCQG